MSSLTPIYVDIGIFAHNEANKIGAFLTSLSRQSIFYEKKYNISIYILANGCTDCTVLTANEKIKELDFIIPKKIFLCDIPESGKSRTWNFFTHSKSRTNTTYLMYIDSDIEFTNNNNLSKMIEHIDHNKKCVVFASRPIKDLVYFNRPTGIVGGLIVRAAGSLDDQATALAGSLYVLRATAARAVFMPVGLPVEDGFLRAMLLTDFLSHYEDKRKIKTDPNITHVYESIQGLMPLFRHQTRIIIGSAINAMIFNYIRRETKSASEAADLLRKASTDDDWLDARISEELPRWPFGYVPLHFLSKRLRQFFKNGADLRRLPIIALGFVFDVIVYVIASVRMARGSGSGFW